MKNVELVLKRFLGQRSRHESTHRLLAVLVAAIWGVNFIAIELGLRDLPPLVLTALRFVAAAVPLVFLVPRPSARLRYVIAYGLVLGVLKFGALFTALAAGMSAGLASLVLQAQALMSVLLAAAVLGERPARAQVAGVLVGSVGIGLLTIGSGGHAVRDRLRADAVRGGELGHGKPGHAGQRRDATALAAGLVEPGAAVAAARPGRRGRRRTGGAGCDHRAVVARAARRGVHRVRVDPRRLRDLEPADRPVLDREGGAVQPPGAGFGLSAAWLLLDEPVGPTELAAAGSSSAGWHWWSGVPQRTATTPRLRARVASPSTPRPRLPSPRLRHLSARIAA